jgi:predicted component of type VI protein secretion system
MLRAAIARVDAKPEPEPATAATQATAAAAPATASSLAVDSKPLYSQAAEASSLECEPLCRQAAAASSAAAPNAPPPVAAPPNAAQLTTQLTTQLTAPPDAPPDAQPDAAALPSTAVSATGPPVHPKPRGRAPTVGVGSDAEETTWDEHAGCWRTPGGGVHEVQRHKKRKLEAEAERALCERIDSKIHGDAAAAA